VDLADRSIHTTTGTVDVRLTRTEWNLLEALGPPSGQTDQPAATLAPDTDRQRWSARRHQILTFSIRRSVRCRDAVGPTVDVWTGERRRVW
jgi:hypothetical protein